MFKVTKMKFIRSVFVLLFIGLLVLGVAAYWLHSSMHAAIEHDKAQTFITIEQGASSNEIIRVLSEAGILQNPEATKLYLRIFKESPLLQAGDYQFPSPITPLEVLTALKKGRKQTKKLTIPEGWTRFEIAKRIYNQFPTEPPTTEAAVLDLMNDVSSIADFDPEAENLEGYLYPTTYEIELGAAPKAIIDKMVAQFKMMWQKDWDQQAQAMGRSKREIVTIASLIENESKVEAERALVSAVIYNRLEGRMALGIDATNVYIAKLLGRWDGIIHKSDIEVDHPYNTRKIFGLPPGPISSASRSAIEAALHPAKTKDLYYVLNVDANDGSHHFYTNAADFAKGKAAYQKWLATQRD